MNVQIPIEQLQEILLYLPPEDLINACQTNIFWSQVCQSNYFWQIKTEKDFDLVSNPNNLPWKFIYEQQYTQRLLRYKMLFKREQSTYHRNRNLRLRGQYVNFNGPILYWRSANLHRSPLFLSNAAHFVAINFPNQIGYDRFVYWPDYQVTGTINDIVNRFRSAGINSVNIGTLYGMTQGQIGNLPQENIPLTPETVAANSFDPLNPVHQRILDEMFQ